MNYSELQQVLDEQEELVKAEHEQQKYIAQLQAAVDLQYMGATLFALALHRPVPCMVFFA